MDKVELSVYPARDALLFVPSGSAHQRPLLDMRPLACGLLYGDPVRSCRVLERCIEVEFEAWIECQGIVCDLNHMDLVIPLKVDFAKAISYAKEDCRL